MVGLGDVRKAASTVTEPHPMVIGLGMDIEDN
jgi:hypothetical protein